MEVAAYPDPQLVVDTLLAHLAETSTPPPGIDESPRLLHKPWSTLYFIAGLSGDETQPLVIKIVHFPDQAHPETSWQSAELLRRGQREFETLVRVYNHFSDPPDPLLAALRPRAYLPQINAVVMDYAKGTPLYDENLGWQRLITPHGQHRAGQMMALSGQWLRRFHRLPLDNPAKDRCFTAADTLAALHQVVNDLQAFGINPQAWPLWTQTLSRLNHVSDPQYVWTHGDFHLRNILVQPDGGVLGFDTALERIDSPYFDLGKFIADLKTRRAMILRLGMLPSPALTQRLTQSFLDGYFGDQPANILLLALYEGFFIFKKWVDSLTTLQTTLAGHKALPGKGVCRAVINPTFTRIVQRWMQTVTNQT